MKQTDTLLIVWLVYSAIKLGIYKMLAAIFSTNDQNDRIKYVEELAESGSSEHRLPSWFLIILNADC
jgi:hypothetical protein